MIRRRQRSARRITRDGSQLNNFKHLTEMLTKRIIPCLDVKNGRTVKGVNFLGLKDAGDPVELGATYANEMADELVFLDITATLEKRKTLVDLVDRVSAVVNIPFPDEVSYQGIIQRVYVATYEAPSEFQKKYEPTERNIMAHIVPLDPSMTKIWSTYHKLSVAITLSKV